MDVELARKANHSSKEVRVDVELVVDECRVVGATVLQRGGHMLFCAHFVDPKHPLKLGPPLELSW